MPTRLLVAVLATVLLGLALFVLFPTSDGERELTEQEAYEAFLAQHPYAQRAPMTEEDIKALPKMDRPDLAAEQNFLLTMDPVTHTIPIEQLFEANRRATAYKRGQGGPLVTEAWEERGPNNVGGRTRAIMFDPNDENSAKVWAGGVGGGLWFTEDITDVSAEWSNVNDFWANIAVSAIAYDPTDTQVLYVGTGEGWFNGDAIRGGGLFKSEDGGETWNQLPATTGSIFQNVQDLLVHPTTGDVYAATREGGLQRSQDDGETWTQVLGPSSGASSSRAADLEISADGETIYVSFGIFTPGGVYGSSTGDFGDWETLSDNPGFPSGGYARVEIAPAPSDADIIYAVTQTLGNNGLGSVYRSDDAGATWTTAGRPTHPQFTDPSNGQAWYDLILTVAPEDPDLLIIGTVDLHRSADGGATWELISSAYGVPGEPDVHPDQHNVIFRPGFPDEAVFSHDGGIDYSANATAEQPTYLNRNNGYNVTQFYTAALNPEAGSNVMLAGAQDNGTHRFSTEGVNATPLVRGGDGTATFIDSDQPVLAIASSQFNNYYRSGNGGLSFPFPLIRQNNGSFINPAAYDGNLDVLYTNLNAGAFYRVTDVATGAPTLSTVTRSFSSVPTHLKVSPFSPETSSTLYIGTGAGRIFRIRDAHAAAISAPISTDGVNSGAVSCIEFGESESQILLTFSNYFTNPTSSQVWETLDGGATWTSKQGNLPNIPVRWSLYNPTNRDAVILATEAGVWETTNFGDDEPVWTPAPGFPTTRVDMLQTRASDNLVMASTHGRGVFTATFQDLTTVSAEDGATVAGTHTLDAAYPNPFQREASFSLRIAQPQNVRVEVFNTAGQRVTVLHDGLLPSDSPQRFTIDGAGLPSGTYLYVVTGERFRDEGRVTLVR